MGSPPLRLGQLGVATTELRLQLCERLVMGHIARPHSLVKPAAVGGGRELQLGPDLPLASPVRVAGAKGPTSAVVEQALVVEPLPDVEGRDVRRSLWAGRLPVAALEE